MESLNICVRLDSWGEKMHPGQLLSSLTFSSNHKGVAGEPHLKKAQHTQISPMETDQLEGDFSHYRKIVNFSKGFATGFL